jgi:hypothetical protein
VLAGLAADGYLRPAAGSPYLRLEIAYYAEMAGAERGIEPYRDLYAASLLAGRTAALPVTDAQACTIAHTIFYLSDYGLRSPGLDLADAERARRIAEELTGHYLEHDEWDNVAKFVLAQCCLGLDPARTPSGAAAIRLLASVRSRQGRFPAPRPG